MGVNAEICLILIKTTILKSPHSARPNIPIFQYSSIALKLHFVPNIPAPSRRDRYQQSQVSLTWPKGPGLISDNQWGASNLLSTKESENCCGFQLSSSDTHRQRSNSSNTNLAEFIKNKLQYKPPG
jgi:hypothetical protein